MERPTQREHDGGSLPHDRPLDVAIDAASKGIVAAALVSALATIALALALRHVFVPQTTLAPWLLSVWGWYTIGFAALAVALALAIALARFAKFVPPVPPDAASALVIAAFLAAHAALILNFYVLTRPIALDAKHVAANGGLVLVVHAVVFTRGVGRRRPMPRIRVRAVSCVLAAVAAIARALPDAPHPLTAVEPGVPPASTVTTAPLSTAKRNLVFITVDTLRADHLGAYGYGRDTSPFIDRLAKEGTLFEAAFAEKPITSPSFASLVTGAHLRRHGVRGASQVLAREHVTIAEVLASAGFATAAVITIGNLFPIFGFDQGFDFYDYQANAAAKSRTADEVTDRAIAWLEKETAAPFFLWVHYVDPHDPYHPPGDYRSRYPGDRFYEPLPMDPGTCEPCDGSSEGFGEFASDPETNLAWHLAQYDGEIRFTNDQLERFVRAFSARRRLDDALLVFTSDHGETFGENGLFGHGASPHHSNTHIPLFFRLPGTVPQGQRVSEPISNVDVVPTFLDLVGVPIPAEIQGRSRAGRILNHATPAEPAATLIEAGFGRHVGRGLQHAMRTEQWCYVWRDTRWALRPESPLDLFWLWNALIEGGLDPDELYDVANDPDERNNLIAAGLPIADELRSRLLTELASQGPESPGAKALDHAALKQAGPGLESQLRELGYIE